MIYCKKCEYEGVYTGKKCPKCHSDIVLTNAELTEFCEELSRAKARGEYETVLENTRILADFGNPEAQREYAVMLEKGRLIPRDLDKAMEYFFLAAKKRDGFSAYRYSRLVSRANDKAGSFWLCYSALLEHPEAFLPAAEEYDRLGMTEIANYYYYRSATCDEVDAIVTLAEKYYNGNKIERCPEYAKWYMDKLTFPPFYAIKFALKLRSVTPKEPPALHLTDYEGLVRTLYGIAKREGYDTAALHFAEILSDRGDKAASIDLAVMYLNGVGTEVNAAEAIRVLTRTAATGNANAYAILGRIYLEGKLAEKSENVGINYLNKAAELGNTAAYETLGDYYHSPDTKERNVALAYELYDLAAKDGSESAKNKADKIRTARESYYKTGKSDMRKNPDNAYKHLAIAAAMGHLPALLELGNCYLYGIGTKADRRTALYWYGEALDAGYTAASLQLGICYARGIGTAFDFNKAAELLERAYRDGIPGAGEELVRICEQKKKGVVNKLYSVGMRLVYMQKYVAAAEHLAVAVKGNHAKAAYALGTLYEFGRGVEQDREMSHALYERAKEGGFTDYDKRYKQAILRMMKRIL